MFVNLGTCCTQQERQTFFLLYKQYQDVFAWMYDDLKTYETWIIQHIISIKEGVKPYQQKLRKVHPSLEPLIQKELTKLLDARIIYKVRHSTWISNLVLVCNKSKEILLCVDLRNVNYTLEKDNYPMSSMDHIFQTVSRAHMFSLLNGFSRYNQVLVAEPDRLKTTFHTKWGTFSYRRMPFGLVNAGATFQRAMNIGFYGLIR